MMIPPRRIGKMLGANREMRVYRHDRDGFRGLKNANVLIYWPHGFGDWVFLSYLIPLLEPSNRYFISRFGDDNTSLYDGCPLVTPLYIGLNSTHCDDGGHFGMRHFALERAPARSGVTQVQLPLSLANACEDLEIDHLLFLPFPEVHGWAEFPYHTKARNMSRHLVATSASYDEKLLKPLETALSFQVPANVMSWVESRLRSWAGLKGRKLCLVGRSGYTANGKNWGHLWREDLPAGMRREGEECRAFLRLMLRKNPKWLFLSLEDRMFAGDDTVRDPSLSCFSYAELFGTPDNFSPPFGLVMKALVSIADLVVGVPAGPYHLAMAKPEVPVVGVWTEHMPSWYDEPKAASVHVMSKNLRQSGADRRVGSLINREDLPYRMHWLDSRIIPGEDVLHAVEALGVESTFSRVASSTKGKHLPIVAVTIGVGEKYELLARLCAESYERQTGSQMHILGVREMARHRVKKPHHLKFRLFQEFPEAETILYLDADAIVLKPFDIEQFRNLPELVCVRDLWDRNWISEDAKRIGIAPREYFNSGFFVVNRKHHQKMLEDAENLLGKVVSQYKDQSVLNAARFQLGVPMRLLPKEFNFLAFENCAEPESVMIGHLSGMGRRSTGTIKRYFEFWARENSQSAESIAKELSDKCFEYHRVGFDCRRLQFGADGTIGEGRGESEQQWEVTIEEGEAVLWIVGCGHPTCAMTRDESSGAWQGQWMRSEQMPVLLNPLNSVFHSIA